MDANEVNEAQQLQQQNLRRDLQIVDPLTGKTETMLVGVESLITDPVTGNSLQHVSAVLVRTRDGQLIDLNSHRLYACTQCLTAFLSELAVVFCQECGSAIC